MTSFFKRTHIFLFLIACASIPSVTHAQDDLTNLLKAGKDDASLLMSAYLDPAIVGLSYGMNGGWFHTAKAHKSLGFDLAISLNAVFIPSSNNTFRPDQLGLKNTELVSPLDGNASTIAGPDREPTYKSEIPTPNGPQAITFSGPTGLDFKENLKVSGVLAPTIQLGIGITKNTDLKIRFVPEQTIDNSKVRVIGFGVMHDVKQWIPGMKLLPFDLSMLAGFTKISGEVAMNGLAKPSTDMRTQQMAFEVNAWLIQAVISKKISVITFYGGLGYNAVKSSSDVTGSYTIYGGGTPDTKDDVVVKDPVSLAFKNNSLRLTAGMRFKFGPFYLNGDYSLQKFNTLSVGLGFSVR